MPDLVRHLLPELAAGEGGVDGEPPAPGASDGFGSPDAKASTYTFRPVVLKKSAHTPDAVLWPRQLPGGSEALPVVLVEVQMHSDPGFHRRLAAETFRLLQQQGPIEHLRVLVLLAHRRLQLDPTGPPLLQRFLEQDVTWVDLEALSLQPSLDPALALLTLPVQKESTLTPRCQQLLEQRPDWIELILPILSERFPGLTTAEIMTTFANFRDFWRDTPAYQDILQEGREEGRQEGRQEGRSEGLEEGRRRQALSLAGRLLERRFGHLSPAITSRVEALSLPKLEEISLALLDFQSAEDLEEWLEQQEQD
jgi:predicted transposase YdaD